MSIPCRSLLPIAVLLAAIAPSAGPLLSQGVVLAPLALVTDHHRPVAALTVVNPTGERVEVELSAMFGYPVTDSAGSLHLHTGTDAAAGQPDATGWLTFYPRRFILEADDRRLVRIMVTAPDSLRGRDAEYWTRVVVTSRAAAPPAARATDNPDVRIALSVEVRSVLPLLHRIGNPRTGLQLDSVAWRRAGDTLAVRPFMRREGSAAWAGTVRMSVSDSAGRVVTRADLPLGVYHTLAPAIPLELPGIAPGTYTLEVEAVTQRPDLPSAAVLQAAPVRSRHRLEWR